MFTDKELKIKMDYIEHTCSMATHSLQDQDKMLSTILRITRNALQEQLLTYNPNIIITCTIKLLFYYQENVSYSDNMCEWKRRRKRRVAEECYDSLLQVYVREKSKEILEAIINVIYQDKMWEFESFCFEIMYKLLKYGVSGALMIHTIWDRIETLETNIEDTRKIIRIVYELLDVYDWPGTYETVVVIERILKLFYLSITAKQTMESTIYTYAMLKKGLEVCIINMVKHVDNDHLLIIVQCMCSWAVQKRMTDEIILEFGSTLEYTAYMHEVTLYEKALTPKIFPLLMQMIGSKSKIISLLGNRVIQYLLDRKENKMNFDTPKIFFEDTQFDIKLGECLKEDKLFCKLHREILHDNLLKSMINHCESRMNLETTYCTICLIATEVPCGFTAAALVCLVMNLQDLILKKTEHKNKVIYHLHATIIAIISLLCWIHKAKAFYEYVNKIVMERAQWAPHLNPPIQSQYNFAAHHILWNKPQLFFVDWEARYGLWKCFRLHEGDEDISEI